MIENSKLRFELNKKIEQLTKDIEAAEADISLNDEDRNRKVSILQHKILCRQTRLDLLDGKIVREAFIETNNF